MYEAPTQEIFDEMRTAALKIWDTYDDTYGYATEKKEKVNSLENIQDNAMVFFRMFDGKNQIKMLAQLSPEAYNYINNN